MEPTRRQLLRGSVIAAAAVTLPIPTGPVPQTPATTLVALAADNKFASGPLQIPDDVYSSKWDFWFNGEPIDVDVFEIYAPGDDTGWAVVYKRTDPWTSEKEFIPGNWRFERTERT